MVQDLRTLNGSTIAIDGGGAAYQDSIVTIHSAGTNVSIAGGTLAIDSADDGIYGGRSPSVKAP